MHRQIATLICFLIIFYLFWLDRRNSKGISNSIWVPFIWMFLSGSRFVSQWINLGPINYSANANLDGSPIDRAVFALLIMGGLWVLSQRRINWNSWFQKNPWVWLYFAFGALSILYSDFPFIALKRWVKSMGNVVMVLVILTEKHPYKAIGTILRRLSFVLLPLSVLFIKYLPELGRAYHQGRPMFTGVGFQKNQLGQICMIAAIYFSWELILRSRQNSGSSRRLHYSIYLIMLPMITWLLHISDSATSLACTIAAICIFAIGRMPAIANRPNRILPIGITFLAIFGIMEISFDVKDTIIYMLGRRPDLTDRVDIWGKLLPMMLKNPLIGVGFESFWLGNRGLFALGEVGVGQAHNGYLDMGLHLGLVGIFFVGSWIVSGLRKVQGFLNINYPAGIFRLSCIVVVALYNWTEATFAGVNNMWLLLLFAIMNPPKKIDY